MIKLRTFLKENFYKTIRDSRLNEVYEIFKNPSLSEWSECGNNDNAMRGLILPSGDFYAVREVDEDRGWLSHSDIVKILVEENIISHINMWWSNTSSMRSFLCITSIHKRLEDLYLAESYTYEIFDVDRELLNKYSLALKKKNPVYILKGK